MAAAALYFDMKFKEQGSLSTYTRAVMKLIVVSVAPMPSYLEATVMK